MSERSKDEREGEMRTNICPLKLRLAWLTSLVLVMESSYEHDAQTHPHCRCSGKRAEDDLGFGSDSTSHSVYDREFPHHL